MADNSVEAQEGTEGTVESVLPPAEEKKADLQPSGDAAPASPSGAAAAEPVLVSDQATVRNAFVARTAASSAASVGGFAQMATADDGLAVRGAYRLHFSLAVTEAVAGDPAAEGDLLRKAYLAHAVAGAAVQPGAKRRAARPAKRSAAGRGKKAPGKKAKRPVARASSAAAKKPTAKRRAPGRTAARPARGGKRRKR